ncbi:unnamed protein product [Mytilus edulis]|uniref:Putative nuclease HARBI1 n=1 Tax=Mytilus edulis TaxID=6550 RepID=A0A8S3TB71_MYTED|nr:unnamed protein product [Mytilus edulis]
MSSTHRAVRRCTTAVVQIADQYICWPDEAKHAEIKNKFKAIKGLPGVIGAVDGTHISIRKPTDHPQSYLNRKKDYSIILQGVCDADMTFIDVFVGWPGSVHDARVYRNSPLEEKVSHLPIESHLLGDGAYPLTNGLITPYRDTGRLANEELKFNKVQSATRNKIECTFGMLKGKWRRLKYLDMLDIPCMVELIFSCTVIHNFVIQREGTHLDDEFDDEDNLQPPNLDVPTRLAFQKRDMLKMSIQ